MRPLARLAALLVLSLLLAGCDPAMMLGPRNPPPPPICEELAQQEESPENLSFAAIDRDSPESSAQFWQGDISQPGLRVATNAAALRHMTPYINSDADTALRELDYAQSTAAGIFVRTGNGGYGFCITRVTRQEDDVYLHAHLIRSHTQPALESSYYDLIQIPRDELPAGEATFHLALTRHSYEASETLFSSRRVLEASEEQVVDSVARTIR